jgi:hypothetical protein
MGNEKYRIRENRTTDIERIPPKRTSPPSPQEIAQRKLKRIVRSQT